MRVRPLLCWTDDVHAALSARDCMPYGPWWERHRWRMYLYWKAGETVAGAVDMIAAFRPEWEREQRADAMARKGFDHSLVQLVRKGCA